MAPKNYDFKALENATLYDSDHKKLGSVAQVYVNDSSGQPEFVTVNLGLFGTRETFIPVDATRHADGDLVVPFTKDFVKDAPQVEADGNISVQEEQELLRYYSSAIQETSTSRGDDRARRGQRTTDGRRDAEGSVGADGEIIAREERLNVEKQAQEAGQARLRKRVRTETEHVDVPVQREELVIERESIDPDSADARNAGPIDDSSDAEEVITLREEHAVVNKETVATEKVNVGKRTVQDTEAVDAEVRKEEIEIDESDTDRR